MMLHNNMCTVSVFVAIGVATVFVCTQAQTEIVCNVIVPVVGPDICNEIRTSFVESISTQRWPYMNVVFMVYDPTFLRSNATCFRIYQYEAMLFGTFMRLALISESTQPKVFTRNVVLTLDSNVPMVVMPSNVRMHPQWTEYIQTVFQSGNASVIIPHMIKSNECHPLGGSTVHFAGRHLVTLRGTCDFTDYKRRRINRIVDMLQLDCYIAHDHVKLFAMCRQLSGELAAFRSSSHMQSDPELYTSTLTLSASNINKLLAFNQTYSFTSFAAGCRKHRQP